MPEHAIDRTVIAQISADLGPEFIQELVEAYLAETPPIVIQLQGAYAGKDVDALCKAAHALKSTSAGIGAIRLSALAGELERSARAGRLADCTAQLDELLAVYALVEGELTSLKDSGSSVSAGGIET